VSGTNAQFAQISTTARSETLINHPHPFLKIKDPKQHPVAVLTILQDDQMDMAQQELEFSRLKKFMSSQDNIYKHQKVEKKAEDKKKIEEIPMTQSIDVSGLDLEKLRISTYKADFVKDLSTVPEVIYPEVKEIYKTITIKNTGTEELPKNCYLEPFGEIAGISTPLPALGVGKTFTALLIIKNSGKAGKFASQWRIRFSKEKETFDLCEPFTLEFNVVEKPVKKEEKVSNGKREYSAGIVKKAKEIAELLPQYDLEFLMETIEASGNSSVEELLENLM